MKLKKLKRRIPLPKQVERVYTDKKTYTRKRKHKKDSFMIQKPMLAAKLEEEDLNKLTWPVLATPKLDGIRCLIINGVAMSRKLKPIRNKHILKTMSALPDGLDGELVLQDEKINFNNISSAIMSEDGMPDFKYAVFDYMIIPTTPYEERINNLIKLQLPSFCKKILPKTIDNIEDFLQYEKECLNARYEGVCIRTASSPYKFGRSTVKEGWLLKFKRFIDSEAIITGFEQRLRNDNLKEQDAMGYAKRAHIKTNLIPIEQVGSLIVKDIKAGWEFSIGSGLDDELRIEIWQNKKKYLGKIVKYKYQTVTKNLPRFPVFLGFRSLDDLS